MSEPVTPAKQPETKTTSTGGSSRKWFFTLWGLSLLPVLIVGIIQAFQIFSLPPGPTRETIQGTLLSPGLSFFLVVVLIMTALAADILSRRLVGPLGELANSVRNFADGDWMERSAIQRTDEIGLLAVSFNKMADEITSRYRSLTYQVEERTRQIRTASEVALIATTANSLDELLKTTVDLLVERFGYYHTSIFLIDELGESVVLKEATGPAGEELKKQGYRLAVGSQSIIGWVSAHNQPRVSSNVGEDPFYLRDELLPETRSEVGIPISVGKRVLGVLDVQSHETHAFDLDTITVLQTLARQIAAALQNVSLLESTQTNLYETSLLYRASRVIAEAKTTEEIYQATGFTLQQTPYSAAILVCEKDHFNVFSGSNLPGKATPALPDSIPLPTLGIEAYLGSSNPTIIPDISQAPSGLFNILSIPRKLGLSSSAIFQVVSSGNLVALIMLSTSEKSLLNEEYLQSYTNLIDLISASLEKIDAAETMQQRLAQLVTLTNIGHAISLETDLTTVYHKIHEQIKQEIGDVYIMVAHYDQRTNLVEIPYIYEGGETISIEPFPLGQGLTSHVIRSGNPLLMVKDTDQVAAGLGAKVIGQPAKSWLGVPLQVGGQTNGAIVVQDVEHEGRFDQNDLTLLQALAPQIAVSVRNAQLLSEMKMTLQAFEQERYLLNTLLENVPDRIFFKNREGRYIRASHSVANVFGLQNAASIIGKSDFDFYDEEHATQRYMDEQALIRSGEPEVGRIEKELTPGSTDRWLLTSRLPLQDQNNEPTGLLGISRDITDLKLAQEIAQRRAQQLRTAAEIARDTSGTLDLDELVRKVVYLVRERFNFYHASIFLLDSASEYAILRESTGEAGRQMKLANHRLAVGSQSIVGQVTSRGEPLVVNDVSKDPTHLPNPLLPDTRAELAIPLKIADRVLGAMDVQSNQKNAFAVEDISILQVLADQLATAVVNAQLFAETQETLAQHRLLHHITTAAASSGSVEEALISSVQGLRVTLAGDLVTVLLINDTDNTLKVRASAGYDDLDLEQVAIPIGQGITGWVASTRQPARVEDVRADPRYIGICEKTRSELAVPLIYRDQLLGVLNLESERVKAYDESDQEMFGTLGSSLAAIIANASLIEQIRLKVDRQRLLYEVTSKIRRTVDINSILETSANEINRALGARRTRIEITAGKTGPSNSPLPQDGRKNGKEVHE